MLALAMLVGGSLQGEDKAASEKALAKALDDLESELKGKKEEPGPGVELLAHFAGKIGLPAKDALALVREVHGRKIPFMVALAASLEREEETDPQKWTASFKKWVAAWKPRIAGETFYVSPDGQDKNPGTLEAPWKTLDHAVKTTPAGSVLVLRGGTYTETVRCEKPLAFRAYPKEVPRIVAPAAGRAANGGLSLNDKASGSQLVGLEIEGASLYMSQYDASSSSLVQDVVVERCKIHDAIYLMGCERCVVSHCEMDHGGEGVYCHKARFVVLQDCRIHDIKRTGINLGGGVLRSVVERNLIEDANVGIELGQDTSDPAVTCESLDCVVRNNVVVRTKTTGIMTRGALRPRIENNTLLEVASEDEAGIYLRPTGHFTQPVEKAPQKTKDALVVNNVVVVASTFPAVLLLQDTEGTHFGNNCYHGTKGAPAFWDLALEKPLKGSFEEWRAQVPGGDPGSVVKDPGLRPDHAPGPSSPCLNAGQALTAFVDDFTGHRRKAWDMGALAEPKK